MAKHYDLGKEGELMAQAFLQKKGYTILEQNWRFRKAEIDIIALKNEVLAVVEVKTRTSDYLGNPQDFVNKKKIEMMVAAIDHYVISKALDVEVRFDIIAILKNKSKQTIDHLKNAFLHF